MSACILIAEGATSSLATPVHVAVKADRELAVTSTISTSSSFGSTSTSVEDATYSTHPFDVGYSFRLGIYPTTPISSLRLRVGWGEPPDSFSCVATAVGQAAVSHTGSHEEQEWNFDFGSEGLRQSQRILHCGLSLYHANAWWDPRVTIVDARGSEGQPIDVSSSLCIDCGSSDPRGWDEPPAIDYDSCGTNICGDVVADAVFTTSDALRVLHAAVGILQPKYPQQYDPGRNGAIGTDDSLRVLRRSVGLAGNMFCARPPACRNDFKPVELVPYRVVFHLDSSSLPLNSALLTVEYPAVGDFVDSGSHSECQSLVSGVLFAINDEEESRKLRIGLISLNSFTAPLDMISCTWLGDGLTEPPPEDFVVTVNEATDEDLELATISVRVSVTREPQYARP